MGQLHPGHATLVQAVWGDLIESPYSVRKGVTEKAGSPPHSPVQSLGREDPLEKGMATHISILAWKLPDRGAWWATVHGVTKSRT